MPPSLHCVQCMMKLFIMVVLGHSGLIILCCYIATLLVLDTRMTWNEEGRNQESEDNQKRKQLSEEMSVVKRKKVEMEDLVKELDADAGKFVSEADIADGMVEMKKLIKKVNSFKQSVKEKRKQIHELETAIEKMERWNCVQTISDSSLLRLLLIIFVVACFRT